MDFDFQGDVMGMRDFTWEVLLKLVLWTYIRITKVYLYHLVQKCHPHNHALHHVH